MENNQIYTPAKLIWLVVILLWFLPGTDRLVYADKIEEARRAKLEQIVIDKLAFYASLFPDIEFVVLDSAGDTGKNMSVLRQLLGKNPTPLDYEHPEDTRPELLFVSMMRIELLLQTDVGSATLFRIGKDALVSRQNVCVVTIDPWSVAKDDLSATLHLLEIPVSVSKTIPPEHLLNRESHLRFTLDHEIFHCLDSLYNGPIPMSHFEHWSDYMMLRDELGADTFGIIMHIAEHSAITDYARSLANVRGLALLAGDPNHFTYDAITAVFALDAAQLTKDNIRKRFQLATEIRNRIVGSYDDYIRYAKAACQAMIIMGTKPQAFDYGCSDIDRDLIKELVAHTHSCYRELVGRELPAASTQERETILH